MAFTSDALIANIKLRCNVPTAQNTYQDSDFLDLIRDEMWTYIVPIVIEKRERYYAYDIDFDVNESGVYDIPTRAIGAAIQNMAYIDGDRRYDLDWMEEEWLYNYDEVPYGDYGMWVRGNQLIAVPRAATTFPTLRLSIFLRPGEPILAEDADVITNITSNVITGTDIPSTWSTSNTFELIQTNPHFDSLGISLAASTVVTGAGGSVTMSATPSSRLAVGDYISLDGKSPIIQVPEVCFSLLAQKVAILCMQGQADLEVMEKMEKALEKTEANVMRLLSPRIKREGKKMVNHSGLLRRGY